MESIASYISECGIGVHAVTISALISLLVAVLFLLFSAILSAAEVALFSLDVVRIAQLEESESKRDRQVLHLLQSPQRLLAAILIAQNLANVTIILMIEHASNTVLDFGQAPLLGFVFQTVIITFAILLFGEIIPKVYASQFILKSSLATAPLLSFLLRLFNPLITVLVSSTSVVNRRLSRYNKSNLSIEELSQALELTSDNADEDKIMLEGIVKFGNIRVIDIMTPRVDMVVVDIRTDFKNLLKQVIDAGYSRIPVYAETRDNIRGVLYSKDLLPHLDKPASFKWQRLMRQSYFVPGTKMIDDLLLEFQEHHIHMAMVVDEYGGVSGLITMEDILEEIVGDIADEYDEEQALFVRIDENTFVFEAKILLNDFFKIAEIEEDDFVKVSGDAETLAGLILEIKQELPSIHEKIDFGRYVFEILAVDNRRIRKVKLYINDDNNNNDEE